MIEEAVALFDLAGDRLSYARASVELAGFRMQTGDVASAEHGYLHALAAFREIGSIRDELVTQSNLILVAMNRGYYLRAIDLCHECRETAKKSGNKTQYAYVTLQLADCYLALDDIHKANDFALQADVDSPEVDLPIFHVVLSKVMAEIQINFGNITGGLDKISIARHQAQNLGIPGAAIPLLVRESFLYCEVGNLELATETGLDAVQECENIDVGNEPLAVLAIKNMARVEAIKGNLAEARTLHKESASVLKKYIDTHGENDHMLRTSLKWLTQTELPL
ncbi:MAG: hypothetical protein ACYTDT_13030 [Planctomycetota bacterium]|jgi:tetratricopeptide (TPR) repeat protein